MFVRRNNDLKWHQGDLGSLLEAWTWLVIRLIQECPPDKLDNLVDDVRTEIESARAAYPWWPADHIHATLIDIEEILEYLERPDEYEEYVQALAMMMRWQHKHSFDLEELDEEIDDEADDTEAP